jgi:hypothetical protein
VVPEVYNINPLWPPGSSERSHGSVESAPISILSRMSENSFVSTPLFNTSFDLSSNFLDDRRRSASLFSRMYLSSLAGKAGDNGTAIASFERIERRVTV